MHRSWAYAATLVAVLSLSACGGRERDRSNKKPNKVVKTEPTTAVTPSTKQASTVAPPSDGKKEIVVHLESEPTHFNYLLRQDAWTARIFIPNVMETLLREDPFSFEVKPLLAEKYEVAPDGSKITFTLRDGVKWHDGQPFTSDDVKFTFDKLFDDKANTGAIRGGFEQFLDEKKGRYEAPDAKTFILHLKTNSPFLIPNLCSLPILAKHIFETGDFNEHPANREPMGTGPYKFVEWKQGERVVIEKNQDYWGEKPNMDRMIFKKITEPAIAYAATKKGEIDMMGRLRTEQLDQIESDPEIQENFNHGKYFPAQYSFMQFNMERPIFKDKEVRKAISMLIDRETILEKLEKGRGRLIESPYIYDSKLYNKDLPQIKFDPDAAIKILEADGWKDADNDGVREKGGQKLAFTFYLTSGSTRLEKQMTFIQNEFKKAGIQMDLSKMEWSIFLDKVQKHDFDMVSFIQIANSSLQDNFELFHSSQSIVGGGNYGSYKNPEVDKLLEQIRGEVDETKRLPLEMKLQELLHDDLPMFFMFGDQIDYIIRNKFANTSPPPIGWFQIKNFTVGAGASPVQ
jgi:peptide/nickel transport system substrate-binding protein